jgi:hypothetical protein
MSAAVAVCTEAPKAGGVVVETGAVVVLVVAVVVVVLVRVVAVVLVPVVPAELARLHAAPASNTTARDAASLIRTFFHATGMLP